jgi:hypothetical protein
MFSGIFLLGRNSVNDNSLTSLWLNKNEPLNVVYSKIRYENDYIF